MKKIQKCPSFVLSHLHFDWFPFLNQCHSTSCFLIWTVTSFLVTWINRRHLGWSCDQILQSDWLGPVWAPFTTKVIPSFLVSKFPSFLANYWKICKTYNNGNIDSKWNLMHQNVKFYVSQLNRIHQNTSIHSARPNWSKLYLPHRKKLLKLSEHIASISSSVSKTLGLIKRNLCNCPKNVKETAYRTTVRPKLEYASASWDPHYEKDIATL